MPLGYCMECSELKAIVKIGLKLGSRECEWAPVSHSTPARHRGCGGKVEQVSETTYVCELGCDSCGCGDCRVVYPEEVVPPEYCPGSGRPIR